jgi:cysteine desulfurase/selenocysteine lyase
MHLSMVSNVTGAIVSSEEFVSIKRKYRSLLVVDCAQAVPHFSIDVQTMHADFVFFTGHKCGAYP